MCPRRWAAAWAAASARPPRRAACAIWKLSLIHIFILEDRDIDDARVLTEAAIFGDKTAVDEETVRPVSYTHLYHGFKDQ